MNSNIKYFLNNPLGCITIKDLKNTLCGENSYHSYNCTRVKSVIFPKLQTLGVLSNHTRTTYVNDVFLELS